jgi:hypothetical protein
MNGFELPGAPIAGGQPSLGGSAAEAIANLDSDGGESLVKCPRLEAQHMDTTSMASFPTPMPPAPPIQTPSMQDVLRSLESLQQQQALQAQAFHQTITTLVSALSHKEPSPVQTEAPQPQVTSQTKKLPPEIDAILKKKTRTYRDSVLKLLRSKKYRNKLLHDLEQLEGGLFPHGYSPLKLNLTMTELNDECPQSIRDLHPLQYPEPCSLRQAMEKSHATNALLYARCQLQAQDNHIEALEKTCDPSHLETLVNKVVEDASQPTAAEALGLPRPITIDIPAEIVKKRVQTLYAEIFAIVNKTINADEEAAEKSKSSATTADAEVAANKPVQFLKDVVATEVSGILASHGLVPAADDNEPSTQDPATKFVNSLAGQGNDQSPPGEVGQNRRGKGRGKSTTSPTERRKSMEKWAQDTWWLRNARKQKQWLYKTPKKQSTYNAPQDPWNFRPEAQTGSGASGRGAGSRGRGKGRGRQQQGGFADY